MAQDGSQILPFYIVCDESYSMVEEIDGVNRSLVDLHKAIASDLVVCDKAMIGVITFSDTAEVLVPLTRPDQLANMSGCVAKSGTSYGAAFTKIKETIETDVADLKAKNHQVLRPVVFFISDGGPQDDNWKASHDRLTDETFTARPHILSFGVREADEKTTREIATPVNRLNDRRFAYLAEEGTEPGPALREILRKLAQTIVTSSSSEKRQLIPPTDIPGVRDIGGIDLEVI